MGEFRELGFELRADLRPDLTDAELDGLIDRLLAAAETRHLAVAAGVSEDVLEAFVTRMGRGTATEEDRAALNALLAGEDVVVRHELGALRDAWYGGD